MSIISGIYYFHKKQLIPNHFCEELKTLISRNPDDEILVFQGKNFFFAKVDIEAFDEVGNYTNSNKEFSLLTGEPLLIGGLNRFSDLVRIQKGLANNDFDILTKAQGVFSVVDYQKDTLTLITDKLGVRPIYYHINEKRIVFASSLRILEGFSDIPKKMNLMGVTEVAGLGYALGNKTPYENIFLLRPGEVVQVKNEKVSKFRYWNWGDIEISETSEESLLDELYQQFESAIIRRLRNDITTISYLSGGLDSRCIVTILSHLKARIHTFNFARPNTQDQVLGRNFAERINSIHTEIPKEVGDHIPDYSAKMAKAWNEVRNLGDTAVEHPSLIWSGEGGSVVLGHVHLSRKIVELMRAGDEDAAIEEYLSRENIYLSPRIFNREVYRNLSKVIKESIQEELNHINSKDPARQFYLFLLLNDQHRKLAKHFEHIDLHRLEFQLPFFDSSFLKTIISIPVDWCLEHKFYVKWLYLFPKLATSLPWQAYPGHTPCPLPIPEGLSYQWDSKYQVNEQKSLKQKLVKEGKELLDSEDFPMEILNRNNIRLALWIHQTGWRDYSYIIENAQIYHKYWKICKGNYTF